MAEHGTETEAANDDQLLHRHQKLEFISIKKDQFIHSVNLRYILFCGEKLTMCEMTQ